MPGVVRTQALPYALGAIMLGVVGIAFRDFALQWQPVPAGLAGNAPLALAAALVLVAGGGLALVPRTARAGAALLAGWFALWVVALHLPLVLAKPDVATLNGLAEITAMSAGGMMLALPAGASGRARAVPRVLFGLSALVFGTAHFVYAQFTAAMVPGWIPGHLFWAYATGTGHLAAGLALVSGRCVRLAATLFAAMAGSFVLLLHVPRVIGAPGSHLEWTMLCAAALIAGAGWTMRAAASR